MSAIVFCGVDKRYGDTVAVRGLDLAIEAGETFVLVGESGSGKTTALRLINRLTRPTAGSVAVFGRDVSLGDVVALRRGIGYVIQGAGLFAHLSVRDNVAVVPSLLGWDRAKTRQRVGALLERVGLPDDEFGERFPSELSGGQRQRVGIARALAADPPLVLLDEPFGALDPVTRARIQDEFLALSRELHKTFVVVTHDLREAVRLGHRIAVMQGGAVVRLGTPAALVREPGHPFVEAMLGPDRLQLRWMTTFLSELLEHGEVGVAPEPALRLLESDTLWDALSQCETSQAVGVLVVRESGPVFLSRETLARASVGRPGVVT